MNEDYVNKFGRIYKSVNKSNQIIPEMIKIYVNIAKTAKK